MTPDRLGTAGKNFALNQQDALRSPFFAGRSKICQIVFLLVSSGGKCVF